ncbi:antibiotic biosynthesis monooxygenase [Salipiger sp. H15]|uniref:Antibiotic biosynthesis monooxygenase n=1 Tax=Alloyangia sp. H15 TaxID=3029062 RepID=A0AAU8AFX6_9RHOB
MRAMTVVKFKPKPGMEEEFEALYKSLKREFDGLRRMSLVKSTDGGYFGVGEWDSFDHLVAARQAMQDNLDKFRHTLSSFSEDMGVTDAMSGNVAFRWKFDGAVNGQ